MKICFLSPSGNLGGAERSLLDLLHGLAAIPQPPRLHVVLGEEGPLYEKLKQEDLIVHVLPLPPSLARFGDSQLRQGHRLRFLAQGLQSSISVLTYTKQLARLLDAIEPDIIHSNGIKFHFLSSLLSRRSRVVWHVRDYLSDRAISSRLLRPRLTKIAGAIVNSKSVGEDVKHLNANAKIQVVYNGIDTDRFSRQEPPPGWIDEVAGFKSENRSRQPDIVRIGLVSTYAKWKGHETFLRAAKHVVEQQKQSVRFYIVGGPVYATAGSQWTPEDLQKKITGLGLETEVGLVSFQDDPSRAYNSLDIVVHASTEREPFGRTIAESMACGRPTIVADAGGAKELIINGESGLTHTPGDDKDLASAMLKLISSPPLRKRLGEAARKRCLEKFSRAHLAPQILAAYQQLEL